MTVRTREIDRNFGGVRRIHVLCLGVAGLALFGSLVACGGSSSETPYPLEPLPRPVTSADAPAEDAPSSEATGGSRP